jgi:xylose dehydrogenase (NAD/NADP)
MTLRVGIVGTGTIALDHAVTCQAVPKVELTAVCDISEPALNEFGDRYGISKRYTDLSEMLKSEQLDIIIVATWGPSHAEISIAAAQSGNVRAILCEKPISMTSAECEAMINAARANDVLLIEGYKWRHDPQHVRIKELIDEDRIGQVMSVQSTFSSPLVRFAEKDNWRYDRTRGGGSVFDTAGYIIHFARYVIDQEPNRVYATGSFIDSADADMSAAILLEFPSGATAQLTSSYQYGYCQATEVLGTKGWIRADLPFDQRSVREQEFVEEPDLPANLEIFYDTFETETLKFEPVDQFALQLEHVCDCLESGSPPRIPPEFSLSNMRIIDAIYESIESRMPVDIKVT